jgi:hypothetical protein
MAWTLTSENTTFAPYAVGETTAAVSMANAAVYSDVIEHDMSGKKLLVGAKVVVAGSDVEATLGVQASHNGTDWVTVVASAIADTTPNVTGVKLGLADLSTIYAPYYRLVFNAGGLTTGTTGTFKFIFTSRS